MELLNKLRILADAAKYDASCASSSSYRKRAEGGIGNTEGMGICHSYTPDGRCVSLLKTLLTNYCVYDCSYCVNRVSSDVERARFTPQEVVGLTLDFYRRNYIEGLFLSTGVIQSPDYTMEQLIQVAKTLRFDGGRRQCRAIEDRRSEVGKGNARGEPANAALFGSQWRAMREIAVSGFAEWRDTARRLLREDVPPQRVRLQPAGEPSQAVLPGFDPVQPAITEAHTENGSDKRNRTRNGAARVPRDFLAVAETVGMFRDSSRWNLLYSLLWRLTHGEHRLLEDHADPEVRKAGMMHEAVQRDIHKMHAFVRFRQERTASLLLGSHHST